MLEQQIMLVISFSPHASVINEVSLLIQLFLFIYSASPL